MSKAKIPDATVILTEPVGRNNCMDETTPVTRSSINAKIWSHFPRNVCVQAPVSSKIFQIWKLNYAAAKSTVRCTGHLFINCLSEGDLIGPLSVAKLGTWHGETSRCRDVTPHHLHKKIFYFILFFIFCRCRLVPGAMPPFNYTGHLHRLDWLRGGVAITIGLKPTAISPCGKKLPIQLAELNGTSLCDLLYLIWPHPMCLELPWKLNEFTVIEEH